jgi:hypothetical protein
MVQKAKHSNFIITWDICKELIWFWKGLSEKSGDTVKDAE